MRTMRFLLTLALMGLACVGVTHAAPGFACAPLPSVRLDRPVVEAGSIVRVSVSGFFGDQPIVLTLAEPAGGGEWSLATLQPPAASTAFAVPLTAEPGPQPYYVVAAQYGPNGELSQRIGAPLYLRPPRSYRTVAADGGVFAFGDATFLGSTGGMVLNRPVVGMATTPSGLGYWLVASDGGVFAFGDAAFRGSTGGLALNRPVVGMAATPSGLGYWLVASDGGIFAFGDATFRGSTGGLRLMRPVVGMASSPSGSYWMVAEDGGIFAFGDAPFLGSRGGLPLVRPVVGMAASPAGDGYWIVASDGGIFGFGTAEHAGSPGGLVDLQVVGMARTPSGGGYWLAGRDGGVSAFGDAVLAGSASGVPLAQPVVGIVAQPPT